MVRRLNSVRSRLFRFLMSLSKLRLQKEGQAASSQEEPLQDLWLGEGSFGIQPPLLSAPCGRRSRLLAPPPVGSLKRNEGNSSAGAVQKTQVWTMPSSHQQLPPAEPPYSSVLGSSGMNWGQGRQRGLGVQPKPPSPLPPNVGLNGESPEGLFPRPTL